MQTMDGAGLSVHTLLHYGWPTSSEEAQIELEFGEERVRSSLEKHGSVAVMAVTNRRGVQQQQQHMKRRGYRGAMARGEPLKRHGHCLKKPNINLKSTHPLHFSLPPFPCSFIGRFHPSQRCQIFPVCTFFLFIDSGVENLGSWDGSGETGTMQNNQVLEDLGFTTPIEGAVKTSVLVKLHSTLYLVSPILFL